MPKLVIANVDSLAMSGSPRDDEDYRFSTMTAERLLVMVSHEDLIVLPQMPSRDFLAYSNALLARGITEKNVVVPSSGQQEGLIWSHQALNDGDVRRQIESRAGSVRGWELSAFFLDRPVLTLADSLGLRLPVTAPYLRAGGAESLNSKVVFREMAEVSGSPVAPGRVVANAAELAEAATALISETQHVIVKQDLNLGGVGNTVMTLTSETQFAGSRVTVNLSRLADIPQAATELWPHVAAGRNTRAVVEAYYPDARALCCEFFVHGPGRTPDLLNFGEMMMAPVFIGLELHSGGLGEVDSANMAAHCMQLARAAGERGFVGYLNVDSLLTTSGHLILNEINARMGGCTHIDVLCRTLIGEHYPRSHVLLTHNRVPVPSFGSAVAALEREKLSFQRDDSEGTVFVADGVVSTGTVEYIVLARTLDRGRQIEKQTIASLQNLT